MTNSQSSVGDWSGLSMSSSYKKNGAEGALGMVSTEFLSICFVNLLAFYYCIMLLLDCSIPALSSFQPVTIYAAITTIDARQEKKQSKGNLCLFFSLSLCLWTVQQWRMEKQTQAVKTQEILWILFTEKFLSLLRFWVNYCKSCINYKYSEGNTLSMDLSITYVSVKKEEKEFNISLGWAIFLRIFYIPCSIS